MTIEDLREHGVLLPEEEWGKRPLTTRVARPAFSLALLAAVAGIAAAYEGNGGPLTWLGVGGFLLALAAYTALCWRAVAPGELDEDT